MRPVPQYSSYSSSGPFQCVKSPIEACALGGGCVCFLKKLINIKNVNKVILWTSGDLINVTV